MIMSWRWCHISRFYHIYRFSTSYLSLNLWFYSRFQVLFFSVSVISGSVASGLVVISGSVASGLVVISGSVALGLVVSGQVLA